MYIYAKSASYSRKSAYQSTPLKWCDTFCTPCIVYSKYLIRKQRGEMLLYYVHTTTLVCKFLAIYVAIFELIMNFPLNFNLGNCSSKN